MTGIPKNVWKLKEIGNQIGYEQNGLKANEKKIVKAKKMAWKMSLCDDRQSECEK